MVATGQGKLILGDRGYDINSYDLDDGNLTVRASSLLGFEPSWSSRSRSSRAFSPCSAPASSWPPPTARCTSWSRRCASTRRPSSAGRTARRPAITTTTPTCAGRSAWRARSRARRPVGRGAPVRLPGRGHRADAVLGEGDGLALGEPALQERGLTPWTRRAGSAARTRSTRAPRPRTRGRTARLDGGGAPLLAEPQRDQEPARRQALDPEQDRLSGKYRSPAPVSRHSSTAWTMYGHRSLISSHSSSEMITAPWMLSATTPSTYCFDPL